MTTPLSPVPVRLSCEPERLVLRGEGDSGLLRVRAHSAAGFTTIPRGLSWDVPGDAAVVTSHGAGAWRVTATRDWAATTVRASLGASSAVAVVTSGLREVSCRLPPWSFRGERATGWLRVTDDIDVGYDFTGSTATRTAGIVADEPVRLPGQPVAMSLRWHGDGNGGWPSLECRDADGTPVVLRGSPVGSAGWCDVEMPVPAPVTYPLWLRRCYVAETDPRAGYHGRFRLAAITARVPPTADLCQPASSRAALERGCLDGYRWRFAVLSDTQFTAAASDRAFVEQARKALRDIKSRHPDFLIINGDFVDEGSRADLALAHRILRQELGDELPWRYVPGNHEIHGGDIAWFAERFGATETTFDHKGTRFITVDSSGLRLGADGVGRLRDALAAAAADHRVESVVVATHAPTRDPTGHDASRLGDREEARQVETLLAKLAATGKGACLLAGHAGVFANWLRDGVCYVVNGNSAKPPAVASRRGGLLGWTECAINPVTPAQRLARRTRRDRVGAPDWLGLRVHSLPPPEEPGNTAAS